MKRMFLVIFLLLSHTASHSSIFGPRNYEECLLDNLKNAKTSEAVNAMEAACSMKFNKPVESSKSSGLKICQIYWDGWKFVLGGKPNKDYDVYIHSFRGADTLEISIPIGMAKFLEVETSTKQPIMSYDTKYGKFFSDNYPTIRSLCAFN
jgi:hypothetical protein